MESPYGSMSFSDVKDDLEALWYAALWFEGRKEGFPEMEFEVYKANLRRKGVPFLAVRGRFAFEGQGEWE